MEPLLDDAARRAIRYLNDLPERRVFPDDEALAGLEALSSCANLELRASGPATLAGLEGLAEIDGYLRIESNPALTELGALTTEPALVLGDGELRVTDNPALPTCLAEDLLAALELGGYTGDATIDGNADACP